MRRCWIALAVLSLGLALTAQAQPRAASMARPIRAVRLDPDFYLSPDRTTAQLAEMLADKWARAGVNLVYFSAFSQYYGARYRTDYQYTTEEWFGREDLLGVLLPLLKTRGIRTIAWFYDHQHKGAWDAHPEWRVKDADGSDYRESQWDYYLSVQRPDVRAYWQGFVADLLNRYPDLDGIDITEPIVNWWGNRADYCDYAVSEFHRLHPGAAFDGPEWLAFRADGLTTHIRELTRMVHAMGREVHLTTVFSAAADGSLLSPADLRDTTGFDLDAVLSGDDAPDFVNGEIVWQTWQEQHGGFTPEWTASGTRQAVAQVAGRAPFITHLELTPFGGVGPTVPEFARSIRAALAGGSPHVDFYDSFQADTMGAWPAIRREYRAAVGPTRAEALPLRAPVALAR